MNPVFTSAFKSVSNTLKIVMFFLYYQFSPNSNYCLSHKYSTKLLEILPRSLYFHGDKLELFFVPLLILPPPVKNMKLVTDGKTIWKISPGNRVTTEILISDIFCYYLDKILITKVLQSDWFHDHKLPKHIFKINIVSQHFLHLVYCNLGMLHTKTIEGT